MIAGTGLIMMIVFLLGLSAFSGAKVLCIIGLAASAGMVLLGLPLPFLKKLTKTIRLSATVGFLMVVFGLSMMTGYVSASGGADEFDQQTAEIRDLIDKGKTKKAQDALSDLLEDYGSSDLTTMLETLLYIEEESFDEAFSSLGRYSNKTSKEYYMLAEATYLKKGDPEQAGGLRNLYLEAAQRYPDWSYMQKMAGIALLDQKEFIKAEYRLLRAYEKDFADYETAYFLGVTCYEQKRTDEALIYFEEAVELGADKTIKSYISWYAVEIAK